MAINLELMRKKLAVLKGEVKGGGGGNSPFFRPQEGEQDIRIVPSPDGDPFKEVYFHYNLPDHKGGILCPKRNDGEACPICEFASSLWKEYTDTKDEATKELAKQLFVRPRYFSPVVVRGKESEGVKYYGYGKKAYEMLLGYVLDPEYGDITDLDEGTDIGLTYEKPNRPGAFPQTTLKMRRNTSPLLSNKREASTIVNNTPTIDKLFADKRKTTREIEVILDNMMSGDSSAEARSSETTAYNNKGSAVDKAFAELAGK